MLYLVLLVFGALSYELLHSAMFLFLLMLLLCCAGLGHVGLWLAMPLTFCFATLCHIAAGCFWALPGLKDFVPGDNENPRPKPLPGKCSWTLLNSGSPKLY